MHRTKFTKFHQSHDAKAVEGGPIDIQPSSLSSRNSRCYHARSMVVFLLFSTLSALGIYTLDVAKESNQTQDFIPTTIPFKHHSKWAQYSPYFPVKGYTGPPDHCQVTQVSFELAS